MLFSEFITHFQGVRPAGTGQWSALCPAHDDHWPSLSIGLGADGRRLLHCQSHDCSIEAIVAGAGLTMDDLFATPRQSAQAGPGSTASSPDGSTPGQRLQARRERRLEAWRYVVAEAGLTGLERRVAQEARKAADALADTDGDVAWALRSMAAELDTSADAAEAEAEAQLRARRKAGDA